MAAETGDPECVSLYLFFQDENGEWYYDDQSKADGWYQDENGEWVQDPTSKTDSGSEKDKSSAVNKSESTTNGESTSSKTVIEANGGINNKDLSKQPTIKEDKDEQSETAKLPPRPADYDYYWYQDEDGNWRNEYDDYG